MLASTYGTLRDHWPSVLLMWGIAGLCVAQCLRGSSNTIETRRGLPRTGPRGEVSAKLPPSSGPVRASVRPQPPHPPVAGSSRRDREFDSRRSRQAPEKPRSPLSKEHRA